MPEKYTTLMQHLWAVGIGSSGGLAAYLTQVAQSKSKFNWFELAASLVGSGFVGLLGMYLCQALELKESWTGVLVGVFGALGFNTARAIVASLVSRRLGVSNVE